MAVLVAFTTIIRLQYAQINSLTSERDKYRTNTETLLQLTKNYKTKDSLNAVTVGTLELKLSEFEKYRAADAALIKSLQTDNRDLQAITTTQTKTINELRGQVRDSIVYLSGDTVTTVLRCVDVVDKWFELHGCSTPAGEFTGKFINRDSLLIAATVKHKRFLGFLWKTRKIKNRKIDAVSKNPNTQLIGVEYIEIEE